MTTTWRGASMGTVRAWPRPTPRSSSSAEKRAKAQSRAAGSTTTSMICSRQASRR